MRRLTNRDIQKIDEEIVKQVCEVVGSARGRGVHARMAATLRDVGEIHRVFASRAELMGRDLADEQPQRRLI